MHEMCHKAIIKEYLIKYEEFLYKFNYYICNTNVSFKNLIIMMFRIVK